MSWGVEAFNKKGRSGDRLLGYRAELSHETEVHKGGPESQRVGGSAFEAAGLVHQSQEAISGGECRRGPGNVVVSLATSREQRADHRSGRPYPAFEGQGQVPGPGRAVKHRLADLGLAEPNRLTTPPPVQPEGKNVVGEVVPRGDQRKHFADLTTHRATAVAGVFTARRGRSTPARTGRSRRIRSRNTPGRRPAG